MFTTINTCIYIYVLYISIIPRITGLIVGFFYIVGEVTISAITTYYNYYECV